MPTILKKSLYTRLADSPKPSLAECDQILRTKAAGKCALCGGSLGSDADPGGDGDADANAETSVKPNPNNRDSRSANHRQHAESLSEEHPPYDNGDESERTEEDPLDRRFRGDEDGEAV